MGTADGWVDACVGIGEGAGEMYRGARGKETRLSSTASAKPFAPLERELKEMENITRSARRRAEPPGHWNFFISHTQRNEAAKLLATELHFTLIGTG